MRSPAGKENGFVLIVTCVTLAILLGLAGLVIDVGRMYIVKSELQAFADAASLSAAFELDGAKDSLARARAAAESLTQGDRGMKWDMGTKAIGDFKLSYASDGRSWEESPKNPSDVRFVKVKAEVEVPLTLLRVVEGIQSDTSKVVATSTAGNFPVYANRAWLIE
jgi:uncharacterized membrane protein